MHGPLAVKYKAAKPTADPQERAPEQGLIDALQSRLHTPPMPATGLLITKHRCGQAAHN